MLIYDYLRLKYNYFNMESVHIHPTTLLTKSISTGSQLSTCFELEQPLRNL